MELRVTATTPVHLRRINDTDPVYDVVNRKYDFSPGTGLVRINTSVDKGATYQNKFELDALSMQLVGEIITKDLFIEIECTGNAVAVITDVI